MNIRKLFPDAQKVFLQSWRPYAWIGAAAVLLYLRTAWFGFTSLDDVHLIVINKGYLADWRNIPLAFKTDVFWRPAGAYYRPLLNLSYMLDAVWGGDRAWAYHMGNIFWHTLGSCLVFALLAGLGTRRSLSLLFSLAFALHPALVQAVAWIPGRNDILLGVFFVSSVLALVNYCRQWKAVWLALHLFFFALALFTKETAVALPVIALAYLCLLVPKTRLSNYLWPALGWIMILVGWWTLRRLALGAQPGLGATLNIGTGDAAKGFLSYLGKIVIPVKLSVLPIPRDITIIYGLAALLLLGLLFFLKGWGSKRYFLFGLAWFLITLVPTLAAHADFVDFLENRLYLPLVGFLLLLQQSKAVINIGLVKAKEKIAAACLLLFLGALSWNHTGSFADGGTFWNNAVKTSPHSSLARWMMAKYHDLSGNPGLAEQEFLEAIKIDPNSLTAYNELGAFYTKHERLAEAKAAFLKVLELNPRNVIGHSNLGQVYLQMDALTEAEREFKQALALDPQVENGYSDLATVYIKSRQFAMAESLLDRALSLAPKDPVANYCLAVCHFAKGDNDRALQFMDRAVALGFKADPRVLEELEKYRK
jgi:protein O-mannosyl-transferase